MLDETDLTDISLLDIPSDNGFMPLHYAVMSNAEKNATLLLQREANPDVRTKSGDTPLHIAVEKSYEEIATLLLEMGADPNVENEKGATP